MAHVSELETRLLQFWMADAAVWRRGTQANDLDLHRRAGEEEKNAPTGSGAFQPTKKPGVPLTCQQCGNPFIGRRGKKYCSLSCQRRGNYKADRLRERRKRVEKG